jgi:hypothetical protein
MTEQVKLTGDIECKAFIVTVRSGQQVDLPLRLLPSILCLCTNSIPLPDFIYDQLLTLINWPAQCFCPVLCLVQNGEVKAWREL